jgi:gas vesicle protein
MKLRILRLLTMIGLGAAAAYLLDPESGEKRRKELRKNIEKAKKMGRKARIEAGL